MRNLALLAAGVLVLGIAVGELGAWRWRYSHQRIYGTVEAPAYRIMISPPEQPEIFRNIEGFYAPSAAVQEWRELVSNLKSLNELYAKTLGDITQQFGELSPVTDRQRRKEMLQSIVEGVERAQVDHLILSVSLLGVESDMRKREIERALLNLSGTVLGEAATDFNPELTVRELFEQLTGRSYPATVVFLHEEQEPGILGYHNPLSNVVSSAGVQRIQELVTLIHESGHVMAQHQEANMHGYTFLSGPSGDVSALEEACAYACVDAMLGELHATRPDTALAAKVYFESEVAALAEKFNQSEGDPHSVGAAYFLAMRGILCNPTEVFNSLATAGGSRLDALPSGVEQAMRRRQREWKELEELPKEYQRLCTRNDGVVQRMTTLGAQAQKLHDEENKRDMIIEWDR